MPVSFFRSGRSIKSSHSVGSFASKTLLSIQPAKSELLLTVMNMTIMSIDANVIIGILTLFVTCIPGIWVLLRLKDRRQRLREQLIQDPETGFRHAVCGDSSNALPSPV